MEALTAACRPEISRQRYLTIASHDVAHSLLAHQHFRILEYIAALMDHNTEWLAGAGSNNYGRLFRPLWHRASRHYVSQMFLHDAAYNGEM